MRTILQDKQCLEYLARIVEHIRDGLVIGEARDWLLSSWLIALDKDHGKARPIAGSTVLFKLAAAHLMEQGKGEAQSFFEKKGVQLGVSIPDGVSTAARLAQLFLELALLQGAPEVEDAALVLELHLDAEVVCHRR